MDKDLVIYNYSSICQKNQCTLLIGNLTWNLDNKIVKCAFSSCCLNFASSTLAYLSLTIGSNTPCCFKNVYILIRHRLELFFRVNFSIIIWETIFYAIKTNQDWCCFNQTTSITHPLQKTHQRLCSWNLRFMNNVTLMKTFIEHLVSVISRFRLKEYFFIEGPHFHFKSPKQRQLNKRKLIWAIDT